MSSHNKETDEEFDERWKAYFDRPNIDGSLIKKTKKYLSIYFRLGYSTRYKSYESYLDLIPEPEIISACLQAC
jgi:cytochrome c oxidase subunit 5a